MWKRWDQDKNRNQTEKKLWKFNETQNLFIEKIIKIAKPLARLIQKKGNNLSILKMKEGVSLRILQTIQTIK